MISLIVERMFCEMIKEVDTLIRNILKITWDVAGSKGYILMGDFDAALYLFLRSLRTQRMSARSP
ncbi:hypothetical protein ACFL0D_03070 [Thermoproteota archaeon]